MHELKSKTERFLSVKDFLVVHRGCEIKTQGLGTIVGGLHALTSKPGNETREFLLICITHNVTSERFMQEFPKELPDVVLSKSGDEKMQEFPSKTWS